MWERVLPSDCGNLIMANTQCHCHACNGGVAFDDSYTGQNAQCPHCGQTVLLQASQPPSHSPASHTPQQVIQVFRDNKPIGHFSLFDCMTLLVKGQLLRNDLAYVEGMQNYSYLSDLVSHLEQQIDLGHGMLREGEFLVISKYHHEWPKRCVACNKPTDDSRLVRFPLQTESDMKAAKERGVDYLYMESNIPVCSECLKKETDSNIIFRCFQILIPVPMIGFFCYLYLYESIVWVALCFILFFLSMLLPLGYASKMENRISVKKLEKDIGKKNEFIYTICALFMLSQGESYFKTFTDKGESEHFLWIWAGTEGKIVQSFPDLKIKMKVENRVEDVTGFWQKSNNPSL